MCIRLTILLPLAHWSITSLSLCPAPHIAPLDTQAPMTPVCGKRLERSGSTKGLAAINFAQATFTIIQRDSRLIALTLSPRRACLSQHSPFSVNTKEPSDFAFIRGAERKCSLSLLFSFLCSVLFFLPLLSQSSIKEIKQYAFEGYRWPL